MIRVEQVEHFMLWSTVVDAPTSLLMPRDAFVRCYQERIGDTPREISKRLDRASRQGTSWLNSLESAADAIDGNRAGPGESELTLEEIVTQYRMPLALLDGRVTLPGGYR
jgi:hypothetical protein